MCEIDVLEQQLQKCPVCKGNGRHFALSASRLCPKCNGICYLTERGLPPTIVKPRQTLPLQPTPPSDLWTLISNSRLSRLRGLRPAGLDFHKLIRLCEELNTAYSQGCYLATIMLTRCVLDHVPPVFGKANFSEVASNHGSKSFKEAMQHLDEAARKIADAHLHGPMRKTESLPEAQQVNFGPQLDVLLAEIERTTAASAS